VIETMKTVNPYRVAKQLVCGRIRWDLDWRSWSSRRALTRLRGVHAGGKAVILCNGPSLLRTDFQAINKAGLFTFGLNKINLLFETSVFRPSCVVAVNDHVIEQNRDFFNETLLPLFLDSAARKWIKKRDNVVFLHSVHYPSFAEDCRVSVFQGSTVTYVAMQLAFHMGFRAVGLVGCDHNFAQKGRPNEAVVAGRHDASHFHPKYFADGATWNLPDLRSSEFYYLMAKDRYEENGRRLYNCTAGGDLEVLPRLTLEQFLTE
jgi:hypothetical protein